MNQEALSDEKTRALLQVLSAVTIAGDVHAVNYYTTEDNEVGGEDVVLSCSSPDPSNLEDVTFILSDLLQRDDVSFLKYDAINLDDLVTEARPAKMMRP